MFKSLTGYKQQLKPTTMNTILFFSATIVFVIAVSIAYVKESRKQSKLRVK